VNELWTVVVSKDGKEFVPTPLLLYFSHPIFLDKLMAESMIHLVTPPKHTAKVVKCSIQLHGD